MSAGRFSGYWVIADPTELNKVIDSLKKRAENILKRARKLEKNLSN